MKPLFVTVSLAVLVSSLPIFGLAVSGPTLVGPTVSGAARSSGASTQQSATLAQASSNLLEMALERSVPYQLARSDQNTANDKLDRIKADPLAIKPELLEAQLGAESGRVNLTAARLEVRRGLTTEFFAWQEAKDAVAVAKLKTNLAQGNLNAAQYRFKSGAINQLEVAKVEAEYKNALIDQENADSDFDGAVNALTTRLGTVPAANATLGAIPKPQRAPLEAALSNHPKVVEARGRMDKAKLDFEIKDNEFSATVDVTNAKTTLSNAQRGFEDSKTLVKTALSSAWDAYSNAAKSVPVRERSLAVAKDDFEAQQARFKKGLVSRLAVQQSQLAFAQAGLVVSQAQHRLVLSVVGLALGANLDLWD
jgi:outer membrane protein TolC